MESILHKDLQRLKDLSGKNQDEISVSSGIPKSTIAKIFSGVTKSPSIEAVKAIVYAMGFTLSDLENVSENEEKTVSILETNFAKKYRTLDEYGKKAVDAILDIEYERVMSESKEYLAAARNGQRVRANRVDNIDDLLPPASEDPTDI